MTLPEFLDALRQARVDLDYRELRDALWIAGYASTAVEPPAASREAERLPSGPVGERDETQGEGDNAPPREMMDEESPFYPKGEIYPPVRGASEAKAKAVRVPGVSALPQALELGRALRPFSRRRPSATQYSFDEHATVERTAETKIPTAVLTAVRERWFDLIVLVEHTESMVVWRQTVKQAVRLFERNGSFRSVTQWSIRDRGDRIALVSPAGTTHAPDEILVRASNRLVIVISDGVSATWRDGRMTRLLAPAASRMPIAVLQLLPEHTWRNTALGAAEWRFSSALPGTPNHHLRMEAPWWDEVEAGGVKLPVVALDPQAVLNWAKMVMASGSAGVSGVHLSLKGPASALPVGDDDQPDAETRVNRFRALVSPDAFYLAKCLAVVPLTPPTMRLVQRAVLPRSGPGVLAEVFLGNIIARVTPIDDETPEEDIEYEFHDGVRDVLRSGLRTSELDNVLGLIAAYLSSRFGQSIDFRALWADPEDEKYLPIGARPFARLVRDILHLEPASLSDESEQGSTIDSSSGDTTFAPVPTQNWKVAVQRLMSVLVQRIQSLSHELRFQLHPESDLSRRTDPVPCVFEIKSTYQDDKLERWSGWGDVLVELISPFTTKDQVYLLPSKNAPSQYRDPRKLKDEGWLLQKKEVTQQFVSTNGREPLEGYCFLRTMSDGAPRVHVYSPAYDAFLSKGFIQELEAPGSKQATPPRMLFKEDRKSADEGDGAVARRGRRIRKLPDSISDDALVLSKWAEGRELHCLYRRRFGPAAFDSGRGRRLFHPIYNRQGELIPTIHLTDSFAGALMETVFSTFATSGEPRSISWTQLRDLAHAILTPTKELTLLPLWSINLDMLGLERSELLNPPEKDLQRTARWAEAIHDGLQQADGLAWRSRRIDNAVSVMLFGDRVTAGDLTVRSVLSPEQDEWREQLLKTTSELGIAIID